MATRQLDTMRAIEMPGGYTLGEQGLEVRGTPSIAQHEAVGLFIDRVQRAGGWWKCDWIDYMETREDWRKELEETVNPGTRRQYRHIRKVFPPSKRFNGVGFAHHAIVASFEPTLRDQVLKTAAAEGWSTRETLQAAKSAAKHTATITGGQASGVFEIEVSVLLTLEAETANLAEQAAFALLKALIGAVISPAWLKAKVLTARRRPTVDA